LLLLRSRGAAKTAEERRTERRTEEIVNFMFVVLQRMAVGRKSDYGSTGDVKGKKRM